MTHLPPPSKLLGVPRLDKWYPNQEVAFQRMIGWYHSDARFLGASLPTGSGKTVLSLLTAKLSGARTVILTATKGLQEQITADYPGIVQLVKGQNNFPCKLVRGLRADEGPCHEGASCPLVQTNDCPYRTQLRKALASRIIVTNYAYYLAQTNFSDGLGQIDLLIADEGHLAFNSLESHLSIRLSQLDLVPLGVDFPDGADKWSTWRAWSSLVAPRAEELAGDLDSEMKEIRSSGGQVPSALSRQYRSVRSVMVRIERLAQASEDWIIQQVSHGYQFTPKWLDKHTMSLFGKIPKVMLMSAILSPRTLDYLGVPADDRDWLEVGSCFPAENTPIVHVPTVRVNHRTDDYGSTLWVSRIDQIIQRRLDRKGIVFTVSYDRARMLLRNSRFRDIMLGHSTGDVAAVVNRFKQMEPPAVLVSPTVTTGWDFAGDTCRYIIVGKIPYPDTRDPVTRARHEEDAEWTSYLAMDTLVQECGRGTRGLDDKCEVLFTDDNFKWFVWKYKHFAPAWFMQRVRGSVSGVPNPLV